MQHSKRDNTWSKWGIFLGVAVALGALVVVGWTFMQNRFQPGSSLDADVTIGIDDMPQSLDIRSDSSAAAERLLVDNVYETLVTVDQDNKLQPGLATSWKTSDDGLTVTLTLQSGVTFSNGHTLDASDAVWSLQQNVTNKVADVQSERHHGGHYACQAQSDAAASAVRQTRHCLRFRVVQCRLSTQGHRFRTIHRGRFPAWPFPEAGAQRYLPWHQSGQQCR